MFQGNKVKDESDMVALFSELGSAPANMEAGKALDCFGSASDNKITQGDGKQAYTQTTFKGKPTWIRIPKYRCPKEWHGKFKDPAIPLVLALYGHPDSGGFWERHCEDCLARVGFRAVHPECWPSIFWHDELSLLLAVYVDDFKLAGPEANHEKGWELIGKHIDVDTAEEVGRFLGGSVATDPGGTSHVWHDVKVDRQQGLPFWWTGETYFIDKNVSDPKLAVAAVKKTRDKSQAKKAARAQGFTFLDQLEENQGCVNKKVTKVEYDMRGFLRQCLEKYESLVDKPVRVQKGQRPIS